MATVTTSTILAGVNTYYDKKFLRRIKQELRIAPQGQKRPLPKGEGKIVSFFRYNEVPVTGVTNFSLTEGTTGNETAITGQALSATIGEYGAYSKHSSLVKATHIDRGLAGVSDLWGEAAANYVDLLCNAQICAQGAYPIRADIDTAAMVSTVVVTPTSTTITYANTSGTAFYGGTTDHLTGGMIVFTSGTAKGQARQITANTYAANVSTLTFSPALDVTPAAGDAFHATTPANLTSANAADKLNTTAIRRAIRVLRTNTAAPMDSGYYVGILSPECEEALMSDTTWANAQTYKDSVNGLFAGEIGKWGGARWISTTKPFKAPITTGYATMTSAKGIGATGGNYDGSSYAVGLGITATLVLGAEAFGVTTFSDEAGNIRPGIKIKNPGPQSTDNPLDMYSTVGWYLPFVAKALNPLFAAQIWSAEVQL